jgi:hypothetical protein
MLIDTDGRPYVAPESFQLGRLELLNSRVLTENEFHEYCGLMAKIIDPATGEYCG